MPSSGFRWQVSRLLLCDPQQANPTLRKFFTLRRAPLASGMEDTDQAWQWKPVIRSHLDSTVTDQTGTVECFGRAESASQRRGRHEHERRQTPAAAAFTTATDARPGAVNFTLTFRSSGNACLR